MKIILLERVEKLGGIGDLVNVKSGYARNYLLPQRKSLRATKANIAYFESKKAEIEERNLRLKKDAEKAAEKMADISIVLVRQAAESGFLFGSVRPADIVAELEKQGINISKGQLKIKSPFKTIGNYQVGIQLHPEVIVNIALRIETVQQQEHTREDEVQESSQKTEISEPSIGA